MEVKASIQPTATRPVRLRLVKALVIDTVLSPFGYIVVSSGRIRLSEEVSLDRIGVSPLTFSRMVTQPTKAAVCGCR